MNSRSLSAGFLVGVLLCLVLGSCGGDDDPSEARQDAGFDGFDAGPAEEDAGPADAGRGDGEPGDARTPLKPIIPVEDCSPNGTAAPMWFVLDRFTVAVPSTDDVTVSEGFDLDDRVSDELDAIGCFKPDFVSPAPESMPGVDNQVGLMLVTLGIDDEAAEEFVAAIAEGSHLLLLSVTDVDNPLEDECVQVEIASARLPVGVESVGKDADGRFVPGQRFDLEASGLEPDRMTALSRFGRGRLEGGVVRAIGDRMLLGLPIRGEVLSLELLGPRIRFELTESAVRGTVGGQTDIHAVIDDNEATLNDWDFVGPSFLRAILEDMSDMYPVDGECEHISATLSFEGVPAVPGDVVDPP